jgi:transposase InsO family protein
MCQDIGDTERTGVSVDKGRFLVEVHLRTGRPIAELAAAHGVHRSWLYKLLARYRREGEAGLEPRSRRPHRSPTRHAERWEEAIVALRKELVDAGFDAGAATVHHHLSRRGGDVPSVSTIWRILRARGFVVPQPHKRPRSSWRRFEADLPNECRQADVTHVALADGTAVEVLNVVDDHSRLCVESRAFATTRSADVVRALHRAGGRWGYPRALLTDNGAIFTASARGGTAALESELLSLGIASRHSRPYHPQTCGKVERFHQTLKRFLARQEPAATKKQLQARLDRFVAYYNELRPHRAVGCRTPAEAFAARERAFPVGPRIDCAGYRVRHDRVSKAGNVTLRHKGRVHHVGLGAAYRGWRVVLLVAGLEVRILTLESDQLRHLRLDPTRDYQPMP